MPGQEQQHEPQEDPMAQFRLPNGQIDGNALAAAYQKMNEKAAGLDQLLADKVAEMNEYMARPQPQQQPQQQAPVNPYANFLQALPEDSMYSPDEYMRQAQMMEIASAQAVNRVMEYWSQQMHRADAAKAEESYNRAVSQVRNQFATHMSALSLEYPEMASMEDQMVAYLNADPEFTQKLQGMASGGPGFTADEARNFLLKGREQIMGLRRQALSQLQGTQQQPGVAQTPPANQQQPVMPQQVDAFGNPIGGVQTVPPTAQQPPPGTVPGVGLDPNYAAMMAAQGMDRSQQFQSAPQSPAVSPEMELMKQRWAGYV